MEKIKKRDSNLELYRIIVMLLIVAHHYVVNSGILDKVYADVTSAKSIFLLLFGAWGKTGINCFVLITGYFMCKSKITLKKYFKLLLEVFFYRAVISIIFWLTSYSPLTLKTFFQQALVIRTIAQGFTAAYLMFFLTIPFINILINNLTEKQHIYMTLLFCFIYVFFGTVPFFSVRMNYVSWFIVLYMIASYIRLYPKKLFESKKFSGISTLILIIISSASVVFGAYVYKIAKINIIYKFVTDSNTLLALLLGIASFLFFKNINLKYSKFINTVSASCFGVLLIHSNSYVMRAWLWKDFLRVPDMYNSSYIILHAFLSVIGIYIISTFIDFLRIKFIETPFFKWWDKFEPKLVKFWKNKEDKLLKKMNIIEEKKCD